MSGLTGPKMELDQAFMQLVVNSKVATDNRLSIAQWSNLAKIRTI